MDHQLENEAETELDNVTENNDCVLGSLEINDIMQPHFIELAKLQKEMKDENNNPFVELIENYYNAKVRLCSILFEKTLQKWDGEDAVDIIDYIFERHNINYTDFSHDDDEYYSLNDGDVTQTCNPDCNLLKRIYDAVLLRYFPKITKILPNEYINPKQPFKKIPSHIKKDVSTFKRGIARTFWSDCIIYLHSPRYIKHFLRCNMMQRYDTINFSYAYMTPALYRQERLMNTYKGNSIYLKDFCTLTRFNMMTILRGCELELDEINNHYYLSVANINREVKDANSEWYENGIYFCINKNLDRYQSRLNKFRSHIDDEFEKITTRIKEIYKINRGIVERVIENESEEENDDKNDNKIENDVDVEIDDKIDNDFKEQNFKIREFRDAVEEWFIEIIKKFQKLSLKINKECFNVNFKWVQKEIMEQYRESNHLII